MPLGILKLLTKSETIHNEKEVQHRRKLFLRFRQARRRARGQGELRGSDSGPQSRFRQTQLPVDGSHRCRRPHHRRRLRHPQAVQVPRLRPRDVLRLPRQVGQEDWTQCAALLQVSLAPDRELLKKSS